MSDFLTAVRRVRTIEEAFKLLQKKPVLDGYPSGFNLAHVAATCATREVAEALWAYADAEWPRFLTQRNADQRTPLELAREYQKPFYDIFIGHIRHSPLLGAWTEAHERLEFVEVGPDASENQPSNQEAETIRATTPPEVEGPPNERGPAIEDDRRNEALDRRGRRHRGELRRRCNGSRQPGAR